MVPVHRPLEHVSFLERFSSMSLDDKIFDYFSPKPGAEDPTSFYLNPKASLEQELALTLAPSQIVSYPAVPWIVPKWNHGLARPFVAAQPKCQSKTKATKQQPHTSSGIEHK